MDNASKIQKMKEDLRQIADKEAQARAQLAELNQLVADKSKAEERLALLQKDVDVAFSKL
jgi:hypothetical protein